MEWGSATDGERIYFAVANFNFIPHAMTNAPPGTPATSIARSWGAIDPATGEILWQTADPNTAMDTGPVSVANGVVYVGSMAGFPGSTLGKPTMFALDARTGKQLWSFVSGGSVNASPALSLAEGEGAISIPSPAEGERVRVRGASGNCAG